MSLQCIQTDRGSLMLLHFKWMDLHELDALIQFESRQSLSGRFLTSQRGTKGGMAHCQLIYWDNLITLSDDTLTTPLL